MRSMFLLALLCASISSSFADDAEVNVFCPAVSYDDYDERGRDVPSGPHRVMLMVVGRGRQLAARPADKKARQPAGDPFENERPDDGEAELVVERVLFGSPPGKTIRLPRTRASGFSQKAGETSQIYGLVTQEHNGKLSYDRDDYYLWDRTYSLDELAYAEALAQARLDLLVLSSSAILVGRPVKASQPAAVPPRPQTEPPELELSRADPFGDGRSLPPVAIQVERVLHGGLKSGQQLQVHAGEEHPIPLTGNGPWVYFLENADRADGETASYKVTTRWSTETIDTVTASLARRKEYSVKEKVDEFGQTVRSQEILLLGPRANAIDMLRSTHEVFEILAARRLIHDRQHAMSDVVAAIEKDLWTDKDEHGTFHRQSNLIRLLGILEDHRADGEVVRLIGEIFAKAEAGATFPAPPPEADEPRPAIRRNRYRYGLAADANHSLAWLLQTLDEADAARLFGQRLSKLRDLAAYGWKDEAQFVLDTRHIEDQLELARLAAAPAAKPVRWQAGFDGSQLSYYKTAFSPDGKHLAAVGGSIAKVWRTSDWSLAAEFKQSASVGEIAFAPDGETLFVAGGGGIAVLDRWDWRAGKILKRYPGHESAVSAMQVSRDGSRLLTSVGYKGSTILFDANTAKVLARFPKTEYYALRLSPDGKRFLGKESRSTWRLGETGAAASERLSISPYDMAWDGNDFWALGPSAVKLPAVKPRPGGPAKPLADPFSDGPAEAPDPFDSDDLPGPIGVDNRRPASLLRKRRGTGKHEVLVERQLSFAADKLLVSANSRVLVAASDDEVEVFAAPDWKSAAKWNIPKPSQSRRSPFDDQVQREFQISPDGELLVAAPARSYDFPAVFKTRTGERVSLNSGHSNQIVALDFAANGELRTLDGDGIVLQWDIESGELTKRRPVDGKQPSTINLRDRERQVEFAAEDGSRWRIIGQNGGKYGRYKSFQVQVFPKGIEPPRGFSRDEVPQGAELRGVIEPQWGVYRWVGLVPGGEYLHVGTQIFARRDLQPVSAANVSGERDELIFSADGSRYALLTSERQSRPTALAGVIRREEVSQRLRVHDTRTGQTRLAVDCPVHVRLIALSADGSRLAAVNQRQEVAVWEVGR
jgi:WD40 repeat protein